MADNVAITAGAGTTIATDDVSAVHYQYVKLANGTADSSTVIASGNGTHTNSLRVTVASDSTGTVAVTNAGTFATQVDGNALTALQLIDDPVFADDAGFTVGTHKVNMAGAVAVAHGSNPDAADANDAVATITNRHRVPFSIGGHPNVITSSIRLTGSSTDAAVIAGTISAGTKVVVTRLTVNVSNATTINVGCKIGFGASTLAADSTTGAAGILVDSDGFPPGGGVNIGDGSGIIGVGADGEEIRITNDAPTSGSLHVTCSYYTIES